jgi:hypothetical protein
MELSPVETTHYQRPAPDPPSGTVQVVVIFSELFYVYELLTAVIIPSSYLCFMPNLAESRPLKSKPRVIDAVIMLF